MRSQTVWLKTTKRFLRVVKTGADNAPNNRKTMTMRKLTDLEVRLAGALRLFLQQYADGSPERELRPEVAASRDALQDVIESERVQFEKGARKLTMEIERLLIGLKPTIADEYRCSDEAEDMTPGIPVTIGASSFTSWSYQTGDNSFTGAAYGHHHWGVICLNRRSNCMELAAEAVDQIAETMASQKGGI